MAAPINPVGAKSDKLWRGAILRAVHRQMKDGKSKRLEGLAERLISEALSGDMQALKEIGDRLDGRPHQAIEHAGEGGGPIQLQWLAS